jgi:protein gp37
MNKTKIEWCDYTWNPVVGCSAISAGCRNCYAKEMALRFDFPWGFPVFMPDRMGQPGRVKTPSRIFVCSMSDLFHENLDNRVIARVFDVMRENPRHTFMLLTKRAGRMRSFVRGYGSVLPNVWLGVTAENQHIADRRIPILIDTPAAVRFASVEPMLAAMHLPSISELDWVIAGPETGSRARPCKDRWISWLAADCEIFGVPFFDKRKHDWLRREWPIQNRDDE